MIECPMELLTCNLKGIKSDRHKYLDCARLILHHVSSAYYQALVLKMQ